MSKALMSKALTKKQKLDICATVDSEGFDYAFIHYSDFQQVKDDTFHVLREAYKEAAATLSEYIGYDEYEG